MDGVVTNTAAVHSVAWKRMFDEFLRSWEARHGEPFREFSHERDYRTYVDGRPRYKGVENFLHSRGISLPFGQVDDRPGGETICALGNRKNELFNEILERDGVQVFASTLALIHEFLRVGVKVGLATSSKNSDVILRRTGTEKLFGAVVDGIVSEKLRLKGKPAPDIFRLACSCLGASWDRAIVVEDAVSGVQAGVAGGFALVVGLARENNAAELREHGADLVVPDLAKTNLAELNSLVAAKRARLKPGLRTG